MATPSQQPAPLQQVGQRADDGARRCGIDNLAQSLTLGDTRVFGANMVNSLRFALNRTTVDRFNPAFFEPQRPRRERVQLLADTRRCWWA